MSKNIFTKKVLLVAAENIILSGVSRNHGEDLADYLREKLNTVPGLTLRGIEERSGGGITHSYLSKLLSGAASNPSLDKLKAMAKGMGVPEDEVFNAARGVKPITEGDLADDEEIAALFYKYKNLTDAEKRELRRIIRSLDREIDEIEAERKKKKKVR